MRHTHPAIRSPAARGLNGYVILTTPGILGITKFDLTLDKPNRLLLFDFIAQATDGAIVVTPDDRDFIVSVTS